MYNRKNKSFIGHLLFKKVLNYNLENYINYVRNVLQSTIAQKGMRMGWIESYTLPGVKIKSTSTNDLISLLCCDSRSAYIGYPYPEMMLVFRIRATGPDVKHPEMLALMRIHNRNVLLWMILRYIIKQQEEFIKTGDLCNLKPLTLSEIVRFINHTPDNLLTIPIHRNHVRWLLLSEPKIRLPSGDIFTLQQFFTTSRTILCYRVRRILSEEGHYHPIGLSDREIAQLIQQRWGISVHPRIVGICRHRMSIPKSSIRKRKAYVYPLNTPFSEPVPLQKNFLRSIPALPGVYEIRCIDLSIKYPYGNSPVIYIGSTSNLRKRFYVHANRMQKFYIKTVVRYVITRTGWKSLEYRLYSAFCQTYGRPPLLNRLTPPGGAHHDTKKE